MQQTLNKVYKPIFTKKPRYFILMGGRGAGRSTVASQYAMSKLAAPEYFRCAIMRYVLGDIRNSIYREITDRAEENGVLNALDISENTMDISHGANSINAVGFRKSSGDQKSKLKSLANYNCVIIEEADETPEADFMQLDDSLRTVKGDITIFLLLNPPPKSHWIIRRWFDLEPVPDAPGFYLPKLKPGVDDVVFIHTNYKDNEQNISEQSIKSYEAYKETRPDHYWGMIKGLVPEVVRGKIYSDWEIIDEIPHEAKLVRRWLDWGYSVDPTSIGDVYEYNGGLILDELCYQTGMQNYQIGALLKGQPEQVLVVADSSEPKSIDEVRLSGVMVVPAEKGPDSIRNGIAVVQQQRISITRRSVNTIREYDNYAWYEDKDGTRINEPKPGEDHSMDGIRYAITSIKKQSSNGPAISYSAYRKPVQKRF